MGRKKNPAAVALGRRGAKARMKKLSEGERAKIARKAALARWRRKRREGRWK